MRPVSDRFMRAARSSHPMKSRARVVTPGQTGTQPDGVELLIESGSVSLDADADVRSTLDLSIVPSDDLWPSHSGGLLAPYGNEIFVERGMQFGGGVTEWCSLGYFRIDSISQDDPNTGAIRIAGSDRMITIIEARLESPMQLSGSLTRGQAVAALVTDAMPWAVIEWDDPFAEAERLGRTIVVEEDRYQALRDLVSAVGKIMYFDHRGVLVIKDPPDPSKPVYDITHGQDGVLVSMSREITREGVYNAVVARGEGADDEAAPVQAVAYDNDPKSPTYYFGSFGKVPRFYQSQFIVTVNQARRAAENMLRQNLGLPYAVTFGMVPNPALEPLDPVRISYSNKRGRELHTIATLEVPLVADAEMTGTTKVKLWSMIGHA